MARLWRVVYFKKPQLKNEHPVFKVHPAFRIKWAGRWYFSEAYELQFVACVTAVVARNVVVLVVLSSTKAFTKARVTSPCSWKCSRIGYFFSLPPRKGPLSHIAVWEVGQADIRLDDGSTWVVLQATSEDWLLAANKNCCVSVLQMKYCGTSVEQRSMLQSQPLYSCISEARPCFFNSNFSAYYCFL